MAAFVGIREVGWLAWRIAAFPELGGVDKDLKPNIVSGYRTKRFLPFPVEKRDAPSVRQLAEQVRTLSLANSLNLRRGEPHFRNSMLAREIDTRSVLEVLRFARAVRKPTLGEFGDWRIEMCHKVADRPEHLVMSVCVDDVERMTTWITS